MLPEFFPEFFPEHRQEREDKCPGDRACRQIAGVSTLHPVCVMLTRPAQGRSRPVSADEVRSSGASAGALPVARSQRFRGLRGIRGGIRGCLNFCSAQVKALRERHGKSSFRIDPKRRQTAFSFPPRRTYPLESITSCSRSTSRALAKSPPSAILTATMVFSTLSLYAIRMEVNRSSRSMGLRRKL